LILCNSADFSEEKTRWILPVRASIS